MAARIRYSPPVNEGRKGSAIEIPEGHRGARVVVTGANGFIATETIVQLLAAGYRVRGTVRDPSDARKTEHLRRAAESVGAAERLELVAADLMDARSFERAFEGARFVFHMAATVALTAKDPQRDIVDPAVRGTQNAFAAARAVGGIEAIIMTSSIAAVVDENLPKDVLFDESNWNQSATVDDQPYPLAKVQSERAAWQAISDWPEATRPRLATINPVLVLGPLRTRMHVRTSPDVIRALLRGDFPGVPDLHFGVVDVRDVAEAHLRALGNPSATGRFILHNRGMHAREIVELLRKRYPGAKLPRFPLPHALMYVAAIFDARLSWSFLRRNLGNVRKIDNRRVREELGLDLIGAEQSVLDTARSLYDLDLVAKR